MRFQVPQFINIEDKIFGPFTVKQFIYMAGAGGAAFVLYKLLPLIIALPLIIIIVAFGISLAFLKYNGRPFIVLVQSFFSFKSKSRLYLWDKEKRTKKPTPMQDNLELAEQHKPETPRLSESKLKSIAWSLDVLDTEDVSWRDK